MTLVLSCITHDYALQVSDRLLTYEGDARQPEETNKAVLIAGYLLLSFAGLARVGTTDMDIWAADRLHYTLQRTRSVGSALQALEAEATSAFQRMRGRESKRHAFVIAGFHRRDPSERARPLYITISNTLDEHGNWLDLAQRRFETKRYELPQHQRYYFSAVGQRLNHREEALIHRYIERCLARGCGPAAVARLLATAVRSVATRNRKVGKALLVNFLPTQALGRLDFLMTLPTLPPLHPFPRRLETPVFAYVPEDGVRPIRYGATVVGPDYILADPVIVPGSRRLIRIGSCSGSCMSLMSGLTPVYPPRLGSCSRGGQPPRSVSRCWRNRPP